MNYCIYVEYKRHDKDGRMVKKSVEKFYDFKAAIRFCLKVNAYNMFQHAEIIEIREQTWAEQHLRG